MRILHLLESPEFSGAQNVVCQIVSLIRVEAGVEILYCSKDGQIREALSERNIPFAPIKDITVSEVKRVINEFKPDIIHAHDMRASFVAALACGKTTLISHIHNNNFDSRVFSAKAIAYLFAGLKAKHIFWVSESAYNGYAFHKLLKKKSEVLYNIIDMDSLYKKTALDSNRYSYDVVYLGRITTQKDPLRLLKVFRKLVDKKPEIKIAIIGTGDLESVAKEKVKELALEKNVTFLGFQSNPYKMLQDAKTMILVSQWEGTPMCVLEAMSLGVPVVSTPVDGVKVAVENGKSGFLSDDDDEIADSCIRLVEDCALRKQMSEQAKSRAASMMSKEEYKRRLMSVYSLGGQNCHE